MMLCFGEVLAKEVLVFPQIAESFSFTRVSLLRCPWKCVISVGVHAFKKVSHRLPLVASKGTSGIRGVPGMLVSMSTC